MYGMSSTNGACIAFAEPDATNFSSFDIFSNGLDCRLDVDLWINSSWFPDIEKHFIVKDFEASVDALSNVLRAVVWSEWMEAKGAFHAQAYFVFIFGVLGEVVIQKL